MNLSISGFSRICVKWLGRPHKQAPICDN